MCGTADQTRHTTGAEHLLRHGIISEDQVEHVRLAGILAVAMELVIGNLVVIAVDPSRTVLVDVALIGDADIGDRIAV